MGELSMDMLSMLLNSTVLVAVFIGAFKLLQRAYEERSKRRRAKEHFKGMQSSIELWEIVQILRVRTSFNRIVIALIHNGGDVLSPSSAKFVTALEDTFDNNMSGSIKKDYQAIPIDNQYKEILKRSISSKYYHLHTGMMDNDATDERIKDVNGILYNAYRSNNVKETFYIYLGATEHGLVWMSFESMGVRADLTPKDKTVIRAALAQIRKCLHIYELPKNTL